MCSLILTKWPILGLKIEIVLIGPQKLRVEGNLFFLIFLDTFQKTLTDFLTNDSGSNFDSSNDLIFERVESCNSNESKMKIQNIILYFDRTFLAKEIFYIYSHEINKMIFSLKTVQEIFNFLFKNKISKALLIFGFLILKQTKIKSKKFLENLINRNNQFKLPRFSEFLESSNYENILRKFKNVTNQCRKMEHSIKKTRKFNFFIKSYELEVIFTHEILHLEFKKIINSQIYNVISDQLKLQKAKKNHKLRK
jgi:hypothetical protein